MRIILIYVSTVGLSIKPKVFFSGGYPCGLKPAMSCSGRDLVAKWRPDGESSAPDAPVETYPVRAAGVFTFRHAASSSSGA